MTYKAKQLGKPDMDRLQELEKKLGYCVVAWNKNPPAAQLSEDQITELKSAEKDMDAILVAYDCNK